MTIHEELIELQKLLKHCGVRRRLGALYVIGTVGIHLVRGAQP